MCISVYGSIVGWAWGKASDSGVYFKPPGLLQRCTLRRHGTLLRKLQSAQNAAALRLTRTGRREHISPILRRLHWLPVSRRINFKLAVLMYQISRELAPTYLQDSEVNSGRRLRSTSIPTFVVPCTRTNLGDRSLAEAGPRLWNSLPEHLRQSESLAIFKRQLKTFFFSN